MTLRVQVFDDTVGRTQLMPFSGTTLSYPGFADYVEEVSGSSKSIFDVGYDLTAEMKIDVWVGGREQPRENINWTRQVSENTITTAADVPVGQVFKARLYFSSGIYIFTDYIEEVSGSQKTEFNIGLDIDANHKIDVSIDGRDQPIENTNWTRDVVNNKITTASPVEVGKVFKARIYLK